MMVDSIPSHYEICVGQETFHFNQMNYPFDVPLLHKWLNNSHTIEQWQLNKSLVELKEYFRLMVLDEHQKLFLISLDSIPFAYCEIYDAFYDRISQYYDAHKTDIGWHLLVGEQEYLGISNIKKLIFVINEFIFQTTQTERIIGEPDVKVRWGGLAKGFAYLPQKTVNLPEKTAMLYFCNKNHYHLSLYYQYYMKGN